MSGPAATGLGGSLSGEEDSHQDADGASAGRKAPAAQEAEASRREAKADVGHEAKLAFAAK